MPFMSKEEVAKKRKAIKAALPGFKVSVRMMDCVGIQINILEGPIQLLSDTSRKYQQVNHFHYKTTHKDMPEAVRVFDTVMNIAAHDQAEAFYDGDYGSVPNFYVRISVGDWDKPYRIKGRNK